jgi:hypothetical protein
MRKTFHLGSITARFKLKGIDGEFLKRWSMWFNPIYRVKSYKLLISLAFWLLIQLFLRYLLSFGKFKC